MIDVSNILSDHYMCLTFGKCRNFLVFIMIVLGTAVSLNNERNHRGINKQEHDKYTIICWSLTLTCVSHATDY